MSKQIVTTPEPPKGKFNKSSNKGTLWGNRPSIKSDVINISLILIFGSVDRTTKDYGRDAKEIGRGSATPGPLSNRGPGIIFAVSFSILTIFATSVLMGSKASKQTIYYSGGGKWFQSLEPL